MAMQGVIEPVEEVGYKNRPPLLEDVSVEGPLRVPIAGALDTLEQRDAIEEDYNWFRYSKLAAPFLLLLLLLFITMFVLTALLQVGDIKGLRDGNPRYYQLQTDSDADNEAGMPKSLREVRTAIPFFTILPAVLAFIVVYAKPRPTPRKIMMVLLAILLVVGAILCFVAFGIGEDDADDARNFWELERLTNEQPRSKEGVAIAALAIDFLLGLFSITAAVTLLWTTFSNDFVVPRTGWREQERDQELLERKKKRGHDIEEVKTQAVRNTRFALTSIVLACVIALGIAAITFTIILHQYHNIVRLRTGRGLTNQTFDNSLNRPFEEAGWSARNTRLRYAWTSIGIITILVNFIPWRSRIVAYIFAFIYFCITAMVFVSFGLDVHELRDARAFDCPNTLNEVPYQGIRGDILFQLQQRGLLNTKLNCINTPFVATAVLEFILGILLLAYILFEYLLRGKSVHSGRKYPYHQLGKIERRYDSRRPVRCELTSKVMTAKEYYYKQRFLAGPTNTAAFTSVPTEFSSIYANSAHAFGPSPMPMPGYY